MSELKDISEKINLEETREYVRVTLQAHQYELEKLEQFQQFLTAKRGLLEGKIIQANEEELIIHYYKANHTESIVQLVKKMDDFNRLVLAQKVRYLTDFLDTPVQPFIHPNNLFLFGEELFIAHRGFMKSIVPYAADKTQFFKQYRALILFLLHPRFNYEQLIDGSGTL
ncbi:type VII secretion protein EssB, partial [Enterococcus faecium]|nr:type VII secretion protein EssB [Enterococcus faecium]